ncbi:MAG: hypothetical protein KKA07_05675 [Bacteroidetes bacterium]|nr:hypothetical protein [Bacteroidota bacterium]MBU1718543.1 hypothetical protein [Bacteroidota bacterium]
MKRRFSPAILLVCTLILAAFSCHKQSYDPSFPITSENVDKYISGDFNVVFEKVDGKTQAVERMICGASFFSPRFSVFGQEYYRDTLRERKREGIYRFEDGALFVEMDTIPGADSIDVVKPFDYGEHSDWKILYLMDKEFSIAGVVDGKTYLFCLNGDL